MVFNLFWRINLILNLIDNIVSVSNAYISYTYKKPETQINGPLYLGIVLLRKATNTKTLGQNCIKRLICYQIVI